MTKIYLLTGAPAVGKSTTANALAAKFNKSIHFPVDVIRHMVVGGIAQPGTEWSDTLKEQLSLARKSVVHMATIYWDMGFVVVIDDFWDPHSKLTEYESLQNKTNFHKILLFPTQQAAKQRNAMRSGNEGNHYIDEGIRIVYESLQENISFFQQKGWIMADTTENPVETVVNQLLLQTQ